MNRKYGIFEKHFDESKLKFAQKQASTESAFKYVLVLKKESKIVSSLMNLQKSHPSFSSPVPSQNKVQAL